MESILDLIFPRSCYSCGKVGCYLCQNCQQQISTNYFHTDNCAPLLGYINIFKYNAAIKNIIKDIKYNFLYDIIPEISSIVSTRLSSDFPNILNYWKENNFVLVPIPLFSSRYNWRGFNQAEEFSMQLSKQLNLSINLDCLVRYKNNPPQVSLKNKLLRSQNTKNIFRTNNLVPQRIILVDDVSTTLSTLKNAAKILKESNPLLEIYGITLAGHF